jgi:hypothetical protein
VIILVGVLGVTGLLLLWLAFERAKLIKRFLRFMVVPIIFIVSLSVGQDLPIDPIEDPVGPEDGPITIVDPKPLVLPGDKFVNANQLLAEQAVWESNIYWFLNEFDPAYTFTPPDNHSVALNSSPISYINLSTA